jgi:Guanine nucleotide exchange factor synembryn
VEKFVRYVGYANAAGYLFNRGIPSPLENGPIKKGNQDDNFPDNVDPMTGKFAETKPDPWAGMSDEEKERESERLFVLFDRLNKSGIIKTEMKRE